MRRRYKFNSKALVEGNFILRTYGVEAIAVEKVLFAVLRGFQVYPVNKFNGVYVYDVSTSPLPVELYRYPAIKYLASTYNNILVTPTSIYRVSYNYVFYNNKVLKEYHILEKLV